MTTVQFNAPFESLIAAISSLDLEKKHQLLEILEEQLFEAEDSIEQEAQVLAEVESARKAYQMGEYQTIQEYIASRSGRNS